MQALRLFISSPSDVRDERQIAGKVIARLQGKYWSFLRLEDVFWERSVARATAHFQDELRNPGDCDIVVGILWSRLGSPLPERFRGLRGEGHATGTEWELAQAFGAYDKSLGECGDPALAKPDVIVYRRTDEPESGGEEEESRRQGEALETYLRREFHHDDAHCTIRRSLSRYQGLEEFEKRLNDDLEALILKRLPTLAPGFHPPPISGNPFMGLSVFDYDDADRFFGRTRAIREVRDRLLERAASGTAFVLIYGASGHGKSSLMRAGIAPAVTRPGGALAGMDRWRRVLLQPGVGSGGLCERLARAILAPASEGELERARLNDLYAPSGFPELAGYVIPDSAAGGLTWDVASLARYMADPEDQIFAATGIAGSLEAEGLCLFLQIDQLEEVFAEGIDAEERASFFRALHGLARNGRVWVIATLRSEFFPRIAGEGALRDLVGRDGGYILPPPDLQSWNEIVRYPALAARLDYEQQVAFREIAGIPSTEEWLHEQILADIGGNPDVLPLLEFCLQRLYLDLVDPGAPEGPRRGNRLSWESYATMGGLLGAIATAADHAYQALAPSAQGARDYLFGNLVRVDDTVTRRRADLEALAKRPGAAAFITAFREAKLLVADEDDGRAVLTLAHESLLTHWPVLAEWIEEHRSDLAAHQRLLRQADLWEQNGRSGTYLLSAGHLAEAERVAESPMFWLEEPEQELLRLSRAAARRKVRLYQTSAAIFAALAIGAGVLGWIAETQKREAIKAKEQVTRSAERMSEAIAENWTDLAMKHLGAGRVAEGIAALSTALKAWPTDDASRLLSRELASNDFLIVEGKLPAPPASALSLRSQLIVNELSETIQSADGLWRCVTRASVGNSGNTGFKHEQSLEFFAMGDSVPLEFQSSEGEETGESVSFGLVSFHPRDPLAIVLAPDALTLLDFKSRKSTSSQAPFLSEEALPTALQWIGHSHLAAYAALDGPGGSLWEVVVFSLIENDGEFLLADTYRFQTAAEDLQWNADRTEWQVLRGGEWFQGNVRLAPDLVWQVDTERRGRMMALCDRIVPINDGLALLPDETPTEQGATDEPSKPFQIQSAPTGTLAEIDEINGRVTLTHPTGAEPPVTFTLDDYLDWNRYPVVAGWRQHDTLFSLSAHEIGTNGQSHWLHSAKSGRPLIRRLYDHAFIANDASWFVYVDDSRHYKSSFVATVPEFRAMIERQLADGDGGDRLPIRELWISPVGVPAIRLMNEAGSSFLRAVDWLTGLAGTPEELRAGLASNRGATEDNPFDHKPLAEWLETINGALVDGLRQRDSEAISSNNPESTWQVVDPRAIAQNLASVWASASAAGLDFINPKSLVRTVRAVAQGGVVADPGGPFHGQFFGAVGCSEADLGRAVTYLELKNGLLLYARE